MKRVMQHYSWCRNVETSYMFNSWVINHKASNGWNYYSIVKNHAVEEYLMNTGETPLYINIQVCKKTGYPNVKSNISYCKSVCDFFFVGFYVFQISCNAAILLFWVENSIRCNSVMESAHTGTQEQLLNFLEFHEPVVNVKRGQF